MFTLGLQGSPRLKGNTSFLLKSFMNSAERASSNIQTIDVTQKNIKPCKGCGYCEKKGYCIISDDDMAEEIYPLIRKADVIVAASPVFFYGITAQLKALIDRCQALWSRKYSLKLTDPGKNYKKGVLLSLGASRGKQLFDGLHLVSKYFFDALSADYTDALAYKGIEAAGDMKKHKTVREDVEKLVEKVTGPLVKRKKILFACRENTCRSQMAAAFAQFHAGDKIEAGCAGSTPVSDINPMMMDVMQEKGIDMAFRKPKSINEVTTENTPDIIVTMGCGEECPFIPGVQMIDWDLPDPAGKPIEFMRDIRDKLETDVLSLINKKQEPIKRNDSDMEAHE